MQIIADRYRVLRSLGSGAGGVVYLAEDMIRGSEVAVKVLHSQEHAGETANAKRFAFEVELLSKSQHPHLLPLLDADLQGEPAYLVTPWMEKGALSDHFKLGPLPAEMLHQVGIGIASALEHLHQNGILHRDIKPANIFLDEQGKPVLGDLGLGFTENRERLTKTDHVVGTPTYLAPELLFGDAYSPQSDLFALSFTLLELGLGRRLERTHAPGENFDEPLEELPHPGIRKVLRRSLRRLPKARHESARAYAEGLQKSVEVTTEEVPETLTVSRVTRDKQQRRARRGNFDLNGFELAFLVLLLCIPFPARIGSKSQGPTLLPELEPVRMTPRQVLSETQTLLFETEAEGRILDARLVRQGDLSVVWVDRSEGLPIYHFQVQSPGQDSPPERLLRPQVATEWVERAEIRVLSPSRSLLLLELRRPEGRFLEVLSHRRGIGFELLPTRALRDEESLDRTLDAILEASSREEAA